MDGVLTSQAFIPYRQWNGEPAHFTKLFIIEYAEHCPKRIIDVSRKISSLLHIPLPNDDMNQLPVAAYNRLWICLPSKAHSPLWSDFWRPFEDLCMGVYVLDVHCHKKMKRAYELFYTTFR